MLANEPNHRQGRRNTALWLDNSKQPVVWACAVYKKMNDVTLNGVRSFGQLQAQLSRLYRPESTPGPRRSVSWLAATPSLVHALCSSRVHAGTIHGRTVEFESAQCTCMYSKIVPQHRHLTPRLHTQQAEWRRGPVWTAGVWYKGWLIIHELYIER